MGLIKWVKGVLYDEEEPTEQIKITPEMRNEELPIKEEKVSSVKPVEEEKPISKSEKEIEKHNETSERELFKSSAFPLFDFDEKEFEEYNSPQSPVVEKQPVREEVVERRPSSNVLEYERKKKIEKRTDYGRYEKTEITETTERKKFTASRPISPVFGYLDKDYSHPELPERKEPEKVDIKSVRDKAFGSREFTQEIPRIVKEVKYEEPKTTFYQETETVTITNPEEQQRKIKTIDELLEDTSDDVIDLDNDLTTKMDSVKEESTSFEPEPAKEEKPQHEEDTLENDLFDLIDSMYDHSEDGE